MATCSSIPAWEISWTEESGELQSMGHRRVGHDVGARPPPPPSPRFQEEIAIPSLYETP